MTDPIVSDFVNLLDANLREARDRRAAILEFDAGTKRNLAEALAMLLVILQYPQAVLSKLT